MLRVELPNNIQKIDKQIQALEWQIKQDTNEKDIVIHKQALADLINHRVKLKAGD